MIYKAFGISTEGGNRTHTMLPPLDFESSASTNSATSAKVGCKNRTLFILNNDFGKIIS